MIEEADDRETCCDCGEVIEDYGDPYQVIEEPICADCYGERIDQ